MFNENFDPNLTELYEIQLNHSQLKSLAHFLPEGFSLERNSHAHLHTPLSSKKHSIHDLNSVNRALDLDFETSSNADTNTKRILRDHSKKKMIDTPTLEPEPIPVTNPKPIVPKGPNEGVKKCLELLRRLKRLAAATPFIEPVDVVGLGLTDYYDIVKEPMDIRTVEEKLKTEQYTSPSQFAADVRKIWSNAFRYNSKGSHVYNLASEMSSAFERYFKDIEHISFNDTVRELEKKVEKLSKQITELHHKGAQVPNSSSKNHKPNSSSNVRGYTIEEKKALCQNIKKLPPEFLRGVWEIVSEGLQHNSKNKEILEFDIQTLPLRVVRELDKYVKLKMSQVSKGKSKTAKKDQPIKQVITNSIHQKLNGSAPKEIGEAYQQSIQIPYGETLPERKSILQTQQMEEEAAATAHGDAQSGSSESSFISDSDSDSDAEK